MKKFTKVLSLVLSVMMVFSMIAVATACPDDKKTVTVTYYDNGKYFESYSVTAGKLIPADQVAQSPAPAADKVFLYWSEDGTSDYIATGKPTEDINLISVYGPREAGKIVVSFYTNGGKPNIAPQILTPGSKIAAPGTVTQKGATFNMWRREGESEKFDFANTTVDEDTIIEASWDEGDGKVLVLSSGNFDKVFSPFFATSAYDSEIAGATQISMLSSNSEGKVYVGEDVPTVVKSYTERTYVRGVEDKTGKAVADLTAEQKKDASICKTVYEFVIKNDIRYSDGTPLTIKDVLFNLYVYLDPVYTGASTVYSTNIVGLTAYRSQNPNAADGSQTNTSRINTLTSERLQRLNSYYINSIKDIEANRALIERDETQLLEVFQDLQRLRVYFYKELVSDWNNYQAIENIREDYKEYGFTEPWEVFLFNCGIITAEYDPVTLKVKLDENDKPMVNYVGTDEFEHTPEYLIPYVFNSNLGIYTADEIGSDYKKNSPEPKIDLKFTTDGTVDVDENIAAIGNIATDLHSKTGNTLIARASNGLQQDNVLQVKVSEVSRRWGSGQELYAYLNAYMTTEYLKSQNPTGEGLLVPNIEGITVKQSGGNDVLRIEIVGVDPKAIWNFGFNVAPMHYYSDPSNKTGIEAKYGYTNFQYPGVDGYTGNNYHLGFGQCDLDYFQKVINHSSVQGVPVGAGTFKASDSKGKNTSSLSAFCDNNVVNLRRNDFFETTGNKMSNAKFEYLRYKVVDTSKIIDSLKGGEVHYGDPSATDDNINSIAQSAKLQRESLPNNGFGYIGVNAKHVPVLEIRQAIMTAIDKELIVEYYDGNASAITVPMSKESWAYPNDATDPYAYPGDSAIEGKIKDFVQDAGFSETRKNGKGAWGFNHDQLGNIYLEYEFVVAGTSQEHPAFQAFQKAATILNKCGFVITVKNDAFALSKLSNGGLQVWAAAWSAGVDPDMYQVYHYQSTASSIKNWGFTDILQYGTKEERDNVKLLADRIEEGRQVTDTESRAQIYALALETLMDLAVEYPTYQRDNMYVYDKTKIDARTLNQNTSAHSGLLARIWEVKLLK